MSVPLIALVLKGYPRLSETFIAQEIKALEDRGWRFVIVSLRHPTDTDRHPIHGEIKADVVYLPEYLHQEVGRVLRALIAVRRNTGFQTALRLWWHDFKRDRSRNRLRRFGQALVMAHEVLGKVDWIYAHFIHTPGSVARYGAALTGLPFSLSAHAKDIWTTPEWEKREKLAACAWTVTCTQAYADHLQELAPPGRVSRVYHGLDLSRFPPWTRANPRPAEPFRILCVARAVAKKGLDTVLAALALLPASIDWSFIHIGGGDRRALQEQAANLGIASRIEWRGAQPASQVLEAYAQADLFVLASRIAADGDRDGLPNVLMEAMASELPVVATRVAAIPELVQDGVNGRLVSPDDPQALAAAISELALDPGLRTALGRAGRERVITSFSMTEGIDLLSDHFASSLGLSSAA
ncbi:MAG: glycosyltransferase family 4 protein [Geminicoccaceae bacterium]